MGTQLREEASLLSDLTEKESNRKFYPEETGEREIDGEEKGGEEAGRE